ncbi:selenocysteine-specific translation elongation factor [Gordonia rubripertincta]|uniref:Selenocysteine-specific elongation factor n=2 Tax=Gordonia rubripertincta TaxID=36822 RepID=A0AAW6RB93_GORRU|nr:selenocysteine-specific translation elongation factor [Gordonia rubripertincta]MDG6781675.1 selenocysteine-specific translation elongation factor [Gordonia rubripertincta]GAB85524.1 selenocysteine-specific elongation factor [Gordonia rubripertincta NBRC 101908]
MKYVVATAGHVDHGKSTLVRALTGIEPDRWEEERRRGLTIDLGFAWTTLPSGADVAFVDVPGHERFIPNMLAGLGPAPVVMFVVAADEGWSAQSDDHRDALAALGVEHGLLVISRADRATDTRIGDVIASTRVELADTGLAEAPIVVVSALEGRGLDELRTTLDAVLARTPRPPTSGRVRFWIDRSFTRTGAGTVVTGTLAAGTIGVGDTLELVGADAPRTVDVRGLHSEGTALTTVEPVSRVAANLRGVGVDALARGDALITPGAWHSSAQADIRRVGGVAFDEVPEHLVVHLGTAALSARLRPFDADHARLTFARTVPLSRGDRLVLRNPGQRIVGGGTVLHPDPPALRRRGDSARRAAVLAQMGDADGAADEVARRGAVRLPELRRLGLVGDEDTAPSGVRVVDDWWVDESSCAAWTGRLRSAVGEVHEREPMSAGLSISGVPAMLELPDAALLPTVIAEAGVASVDGYLSMPGHIPDLGDAEEAMSALERRLAEDPFRAPEADDLSALGLGARELAAAERTGRIHRLRDGVVLLPTAPALAMRSLAALDQPFTTTEARQALGTTRRVVIPLLEHLDARGWTRRIDAGYREVVR